MSRTPQLIVARATSCRSTVIGHVDAVIAGSKPQAIDSLQQLHKLWKQWADHSSQLRGAGLGHEIDAVGDTLLFAAYRGAKVLDCFRFLEGGRYLSLPISQRLTATHQLTAVDAYIIYGRIQIACTNHLLTAAHHAECKRTHAHAHAHAHLMPRSFG
jgi:hypothetical protein